MKKVPNSNGTNYVKNKSYDEINFKPLSNTDIKLLQDKKSRVNLL